MRGALLERALTSRVESPTGNDLPKLLPVLALLLVSLTVLRWFLVTRSSSSSSSVTAPD